MSTCNRRHTDPLGPASAGLFMPGSVSRYLHSDPLIGLATLRGLLLAALDPGELAGQGRPAGHGREDRDIWHDLQDLHAHLDALTFGTAPQAFTASSRARALPYQSTRALLWRHCCLLDAHIRVLSRSGLALSRDQAGRYIREQITTAVLAGLEPQDVPHDLDALRACLDGLRPGAPNSAAARAYAQPVIASQPSRTAVWPPAAKPVWASVAGLALAALPLWARRAYKARTLTGAAALYDAGATLALRAVRDSLTDSVGLKR